MRIPGSKLRHESVITKGKRDSWLSRDLDATMLCSELPDNKHWILLHSTAQSTMLYSELPDDNDDNSDIIWCFGDTTMNMCGHVHTGAAHEANFDLSSISSITKREWNKVSFKWKPIQQG